MKLTHYIAFSAFALCLAGQAMAQSADSARVARKMDARLRYKMDTQRAGKTSQGAVAVRSVGSAQTADSIENVETIITATSTDKLIKKLTALGIKSMKVNDKYATASIPATLVDSVAALPEVIRISASRQHKVKTNVSRDSLHVSEIHAGTGLDTPYDGTGVIIGVIDQGFEYTHPAFTDSLGNLRIKRVWNTYTNKSASVVTDSATIIKAGNDGVDATHATHVTGIATGRKVGDHVYYGMAPAADIYMYPSGFSDSEILAAVNDVKTQANALGQPWVVNMSFGSQIGPHDGSTEYDQSLSSYIEDGGFAVAAMGNEGGQNLHLTHTFTSATDTMFSVFSETGDDITFDIWGTDPDTASSLSVLPFIYDVRNSKIIWPTSSWKKSYFNIYQGSDTGNGKDETYGQYSVESLRNGRSTYSNEDRYLVGLAFTAKTGYVMHAWINADEGEWTAPTTSFTEGDDQYCVAEGAASSPKVIAVASHDTQSYWKSLDGNAYVLNSITLTPGKASEFSSYGPQVTENYPKPLIAAPGAPVNSAYSHSYSSFNYDDEEAYLVDTVKYNNTTYYYGMSIGTSMASPAAAGVIALWLQAYPTLSHDSLVSAIRYSATRDSNTGTDEWDNHRGYGRLNAYAGLKKVLAMKASDTNTSIYSVANTTTPVSISAEEGLWRILFNSYEDQAVINVYGIDGRKMYSRTLGSVSLGQEETLQTSAFASGVYLLNITTLNSTYTRKIVVK